MKWISRTFGGPRRVNHAAAAVDDFIFSFGGYCTGDNYKDASMPIDIFVLNTQNLRWATIPKPESCTEENSWPFQRYGHTVVAHEQCVYLFGGRNDEATCNILFKFDTTTREWSKPHVTGDKPFPRDGHTASVINGHMYVFGGYEESQYRFGLDVYRLNLTTFVWEMLNISSQTDTPCFR